MKMTSNKFILSTKDCTSVEDAVPFYNQIEISKTFPLSIWRQFCLFFFLYQTEQQQKFIL